MKKRSGDGGGGVTISEAYFADVTGREREIVAGVATEYDDDGIARAST